MVAMEMNKEYSHQPSQNAEPEVRWGCELPGSGPGPFTGPTILEWEEGDIRPDSHQGPEDGLWRHYLEG